MGDYMENLPSHTGNTAITQWNGNQNNHYPYLNYEEKNIKNDDIRSYIKILSKKKFSILLPVLIIVPLVTCSIFLNKPLYKATATILIENIPQIVPSQNMVTPDLSRIDYATEYEIIKSRSLLEEVVDNLELSNTKKDSVVQDENLSYIDKIRQKINYLKSLINYFFDKILEYIGIKDNQNTPQIMRENAIFLLQQSLKIVPRDMTKIVDVSMIGYDSNQTAQIINTLTENYVRENLDKKLQSTRKSVSWLKDETDKLKKKMDYSDSALQKFREKRKIVSFDLDQVHNIPIQKLVELNSLYISTKRERIELESNINQIKNILPENLADMKSGSDILNNPVITNLMNKYIDLKSQFSSLKEVYNDKYPKIIQLNSQILQTGNDINVEIKKVFESLNIKYKSALSKENSLYKEIERQKNESINIDNDLVEYATLKREADLNRDAYLSISKKLRESELAEALEVNNVKIIQPAEIPVLPEPSGAILKFFGSIIIGLGLGVAHVFMGEYLDKRLKKPDEVEVHLQVPFLGIVPRFKADKRRMYGPIALQDPGSAAAESYRILRTRTYLSSMQPIKTLLVTSAIPGEGKSTTSANLGISFAQLGLKVLLVDADLRHPSLHQAFHISAEVGLIDILLRGANWQKVLQDTKMENLKILPTGRKPHNPSELLSTNTMKKLIDSFKDAFDIVIFDAPVVLSIPDVEIISPRMDSVLLVHDIEKSNKELVIAAKKILERAKSHVIGIVFNNVKEHQYYYNQYSVYHGNGNGNGNGRTKKDMSNFIDMRPIQISNVSFSDHNSN
jgi:capsular exopolysaccharide synthesis family protein